MYLLPVNALGTGVINNRGVQSHHPSHTAHLSTTVRIPAVTAVRAVTGSVRPVLGMAFGR